MIMRTCLLIVSCWLLVISCGAHTPQTIEYVEDYDKEYTSADSALVVRLLEEAQTLRGSENRIMYFGKKFLGVPYVGHTLELGDEEHLIINLHELDCTTFVETVIALSLCDKNNQRTFEDYCKNLMTIRYRSGLMRGYPSRLHYFTWWGIDNEQLGIVKEIAPKSEPWGPYTAIQTIRINYMSQHPTLYKQLKNHPEFVPEIKAFEDEVNGMQFRYIPKRNLNWKQTTSLGMIHDGDIIAMLTDKDGLDTRHIGIAFWQNGQLHLLHASSLYKKVVMSKETFYEYEMKQPKHIGIRVWRLMED